MAEYIAELIGFVFVVAVLVRWVVPLVNSMATRQQETIRGQLEEAEQARERLESAKAEYDKALAEAKREAEQMRVDARKQSESILVEMREQAQADARRIVEQANQQIESDRQQAFNQLRGEVGRLTSELTGQLVLTSLEDEQRQQRVTDRFLDELERSVAGHEGGAK